MNLTTLSPGDVEVLKMLVYRERTRLKNTTGRGATPEYEDNPPPTTEVYIAKVPPTGIPALTESEGNVDDIPGAEECDIFRILIDSVTGIPRLRNISNQKVTTKTVYNISLQDIDPEEVPWIKIVREKFGSWLADTGIPGDVGTGTDANDPTCGLLILDCPDDGDCPGTGSEVVIDPPVGSPPISVGYKSICNLGLVVPATIYLTVTFGSDSVSVAMTTSDGAEWVYLGPTVDVGTCGAGLRLAEANLRCHGSGWAFEVAMFITGIATQFGNDADFPRPTMVGGPTPFHFRTVTRGELSVCSGFTFLEFDFTQ